MAFQYIFDVLFFCIIYSLLIICNLLSSNMFVFQFLSTKLYHLFIH